jgi:hypothetical protein
MVYSTVHRWVQFTCGHQRIQCGDKFWMKETAGLLSRRSRHWDKFWMISFRGEAATGINSGWRRLQVSFRGEAATGINSGWRRLQVSFRGEAATGINSGWSPFAAKAAIWPTLESITPQPSVHPYDQQWIQTIPQRPDSWKWSTVINRSIPITANRFWRPKGSNIGWMCILSDGWVSVAQVSDRQGQHNHPIHKHPIPIYCFRFWMKDWRRDSDQIHGLLTV